MQRAARRVWAKPALAKVAPGLSVANLGPRLVGTSPLLGAGPVAALAGGVALAGAVAGGLIAYLTTGSPGKQPELYTRCGEQRTVLDVLYAPRPDGLEAGLRRSLTHSRRQQLALPTSCPQIGRIAHRTGVPREWRVRDGLRARGLSSGRIRPRP